MTCARGEAQTKARRKNRKVAQWETWNFPQRGAKRRDRCLSKPVLRVQTKRLVRGSRRQARRVKRVARATHLLIQTLNGTRHTTQTLCKVFFEPRSIKIFDTNQFPDTAYAHFGIEVPGTRLVAAVDPTKKLPESSTWIDTSETFVKRVAKRCTDMLSRNLCEAEFATYMKEKLLKRDDFADDGETDIREWRAERYVELVAKPESKDRWAAPPIIKGLESGNLISTSEYSFHVRPDCSYWLSLKAFSQEYQSYVHQLIHTIHKKFVSSYFTIEFKRDLDAEVVVKNQVAAASSLALYNHFCLREQRLELTKDTWTKEDLTVDIRHYGLTMQGSQYEVWCITPILSDDKRWAGCKMKLIGYGHCVNTYDVRGFFNWINEIHYWGLTSHGPSCQNDAKYMLSKMCKGIRPSDIGVEGKGKDKEIT